MHNNKQKLLEEDFQIPNNSIDIYIIQCEEEIIWEMQRILTPKREIEGSKNAIVDTIRRQSGAKPKWHQRKQKKLFLRFNGEGPSQFQIWLLQEIDV